MNFSIGKRIKDLVRNRIRRLFTSIKRFFSREDIRSYSEYYDQENCVRTYHDNGQLKSIAFIENGKHNGICTTFDETGKIISREEYADDKLNGTSNYYFDDETTIQKQDYYYKGILIYRKSYNRNSELLKEEIFHKL